MTYVGVGGDYSTETSYKYVGFGAGEWKVVTPKRNLLLPITAFVAIVAVVIVLVVALWPDRVTTTTTRAMILTLPSTTTPVILTTPPPRRECLFWGDPHVQTFDGGRPSYYGDGEFWIVKSSEVKIQGRYMGTSYTHGLAATQKVVVGGAFLQGHKIEVEPVRGGRIFVDDQPVLPSRGTTYPLPGGLGTIRYDGSGELVDKAQSKYTVRAVHMHLPRGVEITVFRWSNYLDLRISMVKFPGIDGACGNFNMNPADDTTQQIFKRVGARVGQGELLFGQRAPIDFTPEMEEMLRSECEANRLVTAEARCRSQLSGNANTMQVNSCAYDQCFGQMEHALRVARTFG